MSPRITLPRVLILSLAVLTVLITWVPSHSEAAVVQQVEMGDAEEDERNISADEGVLDTLLLKESIGGDFEMRNFILKEINDTVSSIEDLEYLLQVVRTKHSNNRERRQKPPSGGRGGRYPRCSFYVTTPTIVQGYCYYDFGNLVTCKSGDRLSFEATECPRNRPRY